MAIHRVELLFVKTSFSPGKSRLVLHSMESVGDRFHFHLWISSSVVNIAPNAIQCFEWHTFEMQFSIIVIQLVDNCQKIEMPSATHRIFKYEASLVFLANFDKLTTNVCRPFEILGIRVSGKLSQIFLTMVNLEEGFLIGYIS